MLRMNNEYPVHYYHEVRCPNCSSEDLEIYDNKNNPLFFTRIKKYHLNCSNARYFKCRTCKREFDIDWTDIIPKPLNHKLIDKFMQNFSEYSL